MGHSHAKYQTLNQDMATETEGNIGSGLEQTHKY